MRTNRAFPVGLGILLLFLFAAGFLHQQPKNCPTPLSRLDLLHALSLQGTLRIDAYDNTPDRATFHGHSYSDKAPGTVVLALPPFTLAAAALKLGGINLDSSQGWLLSSWFTCFGSVALIGALGAACLYAWLLRYTPPRSALLTVLALFLGSAPLPYATMLFSHTLVVGCIAIALLAILRAVSKPAILPGENSPGHAQAPPAAPGLDLKSKPGRWTILAGFACGWAVACEYTAGLVVAGLFLWLISHGWRRALPFCLGALPPLLLIPLYSWLCFGNPLLLPYSLNESFPAMREGLYAIKWPDPETAFNLLLSPTRGLFFWTPFLVLALVGYWDLVAINRRLFWLSYAVPLFQVVAISGRVWDWQAGPTLGPRYLAPMLPLLALPCALGAKRFPKLAIALAAGSITLTALATLINASPPGHIYNPLVEFHWPALLRGELQPNLVSAIGLPAWAAVMFYLASLFAGSVWLWRNDETGSPKPEGNSTSEDKR